jgi:hypothetical protein
MDDAGHAPPSELPEDLPEPSHLAEYAERTRLDYETDQILERGFHQALIEFAKDAIPRAQSGAEAVRNAAAAIGVLYAGVLGVAFSVGDRPLPLRGTIPAVFLGLAIALATAYLALLTHPPNPSDRDDSTAWPTGGGTVREDAQERTGAFIEYVRATTRQRSNLLTAGVVSLGLGVAFLPVAFLDLGTGGKATPAISWPSGPTQVSSPDLRRILYQAQVTEAAQQRKSQSTSPSESFRKPGVIAVYAAAGLGLVWVLGALGWPRIRRRRSPPDADDDAQPDVPGGGSHAGSP